MERRICKTCAMDLPIDAFRNRSVKGKFVRLKECRECVRRKRREAYQADPSKIRDYENERRRNDPRVQEVHNAASKRWRENNPDRTRETARAWRQANPEKCAAYSREWRAKDPANAETMRALAKAGRARRKGAKTEVVRKADLAGLLSRQGFKCAVCGKSIRKRGSRHLDHIIPIARGGEHALRNLQYLCKGCNLSKSHKAPEDFMRERGFLL